MLRWGEPRFTRDVDVTLLCPFGYEDEISAPLLDAGYIGRISDAQEFARQNRVLLIQNRHGVPIDVASGALPYEEDPASASSLRITRSSAEQVRSTHPASNSNRLDRSSDVGHYTFGRTISNRSEVRT